MEKEKQELLVSPEEYVKASVYLGTKVITADMRQYIYKRRADGLAILDTGAIDERIRIAVNFMLQYNPEDIIICCKREAGWKAVQAFSFATGIRCFTRKYPTGIITNLKLPDFFEPSILFICDPWLDKNALHDAVKIGIPVIALCDTNNLARYIDLVVPCNNKAGKSLGLIFYLFATQYCKTRKIKKKINKEDFIEEE